MARGSNTLSASPSRASLFGRSLAAAALAGLVVGLYVGVYLVTNNVITGFVARLAVVALMGAAYAAVLVVPLTALLGGIGLMRRRRTGVVPSFAQTLSLAVLMLAAAICVRHLFGGIEDVREGYKALTVIPDRAYWALPAVVAVLLTRVPQLIGRHGSAPSPVRWTAITAGSLIAATMLVVSVLPTASSLGALRGDGQRLLASEATASFSVAGPNRQVAIIGFDGVDPVLLDVFVEGGHMPAFAKLKQTAASSNLETSPEGLSPPIWTTFATGVGPDKHGIHDFFVRRLGSTELDLSALKKHPSGYATTTLLGALIRSPFVSERPITPAHRSAPALWTLAEETGLSSCVIDWMGTWPAEQITGVMISDRSFFAQNQGDLAVVTNDITGTSLPLRLMATENLAAGGEEPRLCSPEPQCRDFLPTVVASERVDVRETARFHVAENDFYLRAAEAALSAEACRNADLTIFYSHLPDFLNHMLSPVELDHLYAGNYTGEMEGLSLRVYKEVDRTLGRLLDLIGNQRAVLVVSDHGVEIVGEEPNREVSHFRGPPGVFFARPSADRTAASIVTTPTIYQIVPTALALLGLPLPEFLDGSVIDGVVAAELGEDTLLRTIDLSLANYAANEEDENATLNIDASSRERLRALGYVE